MLVIPPPPHIKVASNTRPGSKLGGTTLNGREKGGQYYISQTCDQEGFEARKVVFVGVSQHFCNWLQLQSKRFWKCKKRPQLPDPCIQKNIIYLFHGPIIISTNCSEVTDFPKTFPILLLIIWSAYSVHSWLSCPICPCFIKYNTFRIFAIFKTAVSNTAGCYPC